MTLTRQSSLFVFLLGFAFAAHRTRSERVIKISNNAVLGRYFQIYIKLRKFVSKNDISCFVKRKMRILFLVKWQKANLFSVKRDLNPPPPPPPHLPPCDKCVWAYGKYDCIVSPVLNLHTAPKLRPIFLGVSQKHMHKFLFMLHRHKTFIPSNSMSVLLDPTNFKSSFATSHLGTSANLP